MVLAGLAGPSGASAAGSSSLPGVPSGHRPGPDVLYAPAPRAPQLENTGIWKAPPILVSGASAYRDGEFLYQDFLYDDRGAEGLKDPTDPFDPVDFLYSPHAGTLTYPTDKVFANNAADLVELRVKPLPDATAFRVTLNSLRDPARSAFTIALGASPDPRPWPHGAGVQSPARLFLTWHGSTADLLDAATGAPVTPAPAVSVDLERRQIEVRVPHAAWNPGRTVVRMSAGTGLWDVKAGTYLKPGAIATATQPGGASPFGSAIFNLAFRYDEPMPKLATNPPGTTMVDSAVGGSLEGNFWREKGQAEALLAGNAGRYSAEVDFAKLAAGIDDESRVPATGAFDRIMASRFDTGQGVDYKRMCGGLGGALQSGPVKGCDGQLVGQLQPYAVYVPRGPRPSSGWGLTLLLHSLSANYNQYLNSHNQSQYGDRGAGTIVVTPAGRGPDGFYQDLAEADTFEVWADAARHYPLDPSWTVVSGYSMGGAGTFRLMGRYPDLFARGQSTVGSGISGVDYLPSLRNTPIQVWNGVPDELDNIAMSEGAVQAMTKAGIRFDSWLFPLDDHLGLGTNDEYGPAAAFLGEHKVDRDPAHVTYVVAPGQDSGRADVVADHAYWLSGVTVRGTAPGRSGRIDARSLAFGEGDRAVLPVKSSTGVLRGGARGPQPYVRRTREWGPAPSAPKADRLVVRAAGIATATVDAARARLSCAPQLDVQADGPLDLRIACPAAAAPKRCASRMTLAVPRVRGRRVVRVTVLRGRRTVARRSGRNVRTVRVRRPTRRAFSLRLRARTSGGRARTIEVVRRYRACR
jgi:hypothetical protein